VTLVGGQSNNAGWEIASGATLNVQHSATLSNLSVDLGTPQKFMQLSYTFSAVDNVVPTSLEEYSWSKLKTVANDLSVNGTSSSYYDEFHTYMLNKETKTVTLPTDDTELSGVSFSVQVIGINHNDKTDGTGKAGLTFRVYNDSTNGLGERSMNSSRTNDGGWEKSEMRT
jgi:hypothetical protein